MGITKKQYLLVRQSINKVLKRKKKGYLAGKVQKIEDNNNSDPLKQGLEKHLPIVAV